MVLPALIVFILYRLQLDDVIEHVFVTKVRLTHVLREWHIVGLPLLVNQFFGQLDHVTDVFVEVERALNNENDFLGNITFGE